MLRLQFVSLNLFSWTFCLFEVGNHVPLFLLHFPDLINSRRQMFIVASVSWRTMQYTFYHWCKLVPSYLLFFSTAVVVNFSPSFALLSPQQPLNWHYASAARVILHDDYSNENNYGDDFIKCKLKDLCVTFDIPNTHTKGRQAVKYTAWKETFWTQ